MTRISHSSLISSIAALALSATACMTDGMEPIDNDALDAEAQAIAQQLELENGGLDMTDEAAMFDDDALLDEAGLADAAEIAYTDEMETAPEVTELIGQPDAVLYHTTVMWGQFPGDFTNDTPYNWSGVLRVNRGAIIVRSVLRFDGRTDHLLPRDPSRPNVVGFTSATLPHRDGLRLLIVDPTPEAAEPLVLTYAQVDGDTFSAPMAALLFSPQSQEMDQAGNRIVAVAMPQAVEVCENGFLGGMWRKVADHRGRILGRAVNAEGEIAGHMRGIYGRRANGERVFFGKYINRAGEFRGILHGTYADGHFIGRWQTRDGDVGGLRGEYVENLPGPRVGGHYMGRWAETRCNLPMVTDRE